ncbi:hypothetical protein LPW11_13580 [Geomonas sp. RF6]|uniref:hypothetical protein n=1 Tax=Geomonas sp. RF6 TaxID=2897342 RepID=UPI001E295261|nr:hypothetical protein [Geomonas sp. RF6]UFS68926.1 hypothetical protein LPW11_13580 [Geomonas sp. RF6]
MSYKLNVQLFMADGSSSTIPTVRRAALYVGAVCLISLFLTRCAALCVCSVVALLVRCYPSKVLLTKASEELAPGLVLKPVLFHY